jgi:hypothetical protein
MGVLFWNILNQRFSLVPERRPLNIFTTAKICSGGILQLRMMIIGTGAIGSIIGGRRAYPGDLFANGTRQDSASTYFI